MISAWCDLIDGLKISGQLKIIYASIDLDFWAEVTTCQAGLLDLG